MGAGVLAQGGVPLNASGRRHQLWLRKSIVELVQVRCHFLRVSHLGVLRWHSRGLHLAALFRGAFVQAVRVEPTLASAMETNHRVSVERYMISANWRLGAAICVVRDSLNCVHPVAKIYRSALYIFHVLVKLGIDYAVSGADFGSHSTRSRHQRLKLAFGSPCGNFETAVKSHGSDGLLERRRSLMVKVILVCGHSVRKVTSLPFFVSHDLQATVVTNYTRIARLVVRCLLRQDGCDVVLGSHWHDRRLFGGSAFII